MMGGGGQSAGGSGLGGTVLELPNQGVAADWWQKTLGPLYDLSANAGAGTPAGQAYPQAQNFVYNYLTGKEGRDTPFNDLITRSFMPAYTAADYAANTLYPRGTAQGDTLNDMGVTGFPYATQALTQGFDPAYQRIVDYINNDPYRSQALIGSQAGAAMGKTGAQNIQGMAGQIRNTGFDPQAAIFNRGRQRVMDTTNAVNSMSGLAGTPYGASVGANALTNYDLDWQDRQLGRQAQAGGASSALYQAAPGLANASAAMPSATEQGQLARGLAGYQARDQAGIQGLAGFGSGAGTVGNLFAGAQNAGTQAARTGMELGAAPYNLGTSVASNALSGLSNLTNLGNAQYTLPRQVLGDLMQYLGRGQSASQISSQMGERGFNQTSSGIGGLFSGLKTIGSLAMTPFGAAPAGSLAASI